MTISADDHLVITHFSIILILQHVPIMISDLLEEQHALRDVLNYAGTTTGALCVMTCGTA